MCHTTPPKQFLSDKNSTLIEANLVPLSKVFYDPIETRAESVLQPDVLEKATEENFIKAQSIVSNWYVVLFIIGVAADDDLCICCYHFKLGSLN
ncbi:unnamed protein product [Trichobilharzia regenti]|nr:unnamed protein product [Trichobilharzia regenti]